jgi:HEAT repeat protein
MGEKAATNEVINRLLLILGDADDAVRSSVCQALGEMGEKAATNEVINRLLLLLGDTDYLVRSGACLALGKIGEKAATNEVINRLLLADSDCLGSNSACAALGKLGEKAATNEVIGVLLDTCEMHKGVVPVNTVSTMTKIFDLLPCMSLLKADTVQKLSKHIDDWDCMFLGNISPEKLIEAFLDTKISWWFPIMKSVFTRRGYGITVTENTIVVYGNKEPVKIPFSSIELCQQLHQYFVNSLENSLQRCE